VKFYWSTGSVPELAKLPKMQQLEIWRDCMRGVAPVRTSFYEFPGHPRRLPQFGPDCFLSSSGRLNFVTSCKFSVPDRDCAASRDC